MVIVLDLHDRRRRRQGPRRVTGHHPMPQEPPIRHIIHEINKHGQPDFVVMLPDLNDRRWRRQGLRRVPGHNPEPQEPALQEVPVKPTWLDLFYFRGFYFNLLKYPLELKTFMGADINSPLQSIYL